MDASAINAIGALALGAADANKLATPTPAIVLGGEVKSLERLQAGRSRFRGKLSTPSLADFVAYVKADHGLSADAKPTGFIDAGNLSATAFFNLGDHQSPGHADHRAVLKLDPTASYRAVRGIVGKRLTQKGLADFLEVWALNLSAFDESDNVLPVRQAAAAVRSVKIKADRESTSTVKNFGATKSALEEIEAKAAGLHALPARLRFDFVPALGLPQQSAELRVSLVISDDDPTFELNWPTREQVEEKIAQDFKAVLIEEIGEAAQLVIGIFEP
jgi:uncharacterized protein YfdQ (DUF2303 family)